MPDPVLNGSTLADVLGARAAADPARIALLVDGRSITRGQLARAVSEATATLRDRWEVERGHRVAYFGLNRHEELVLLFALARLGAVLVPLNTRLAAAELAGIVAHAQLHTLVADSGHRAVGTVVLDSAATCSDRPAQTVRLRSIDELCERPDAGRGPRSAPGPDADPVDPHWPVLMVYTSGATGAP